MTRSIALLIACLVLPGFATADPGVGDTAPDFELMGSDGQVHRLRDYRGRQPVVIAFFPKAFTGG